MSSTRCQLSQQQYHNPQILRRNSSNSLSCIKKNYTKVTKINNNSNLMNYKQYTPNVTPQISRSISGEIDKLNGVKNGFNEIGQNSFGYRQVLEGKNGNLEATPITTETVAACIASILYDMIVDGEEMFTIGHCNDSLYDTFCG